VLLADLAILVAMAMVQSWLFHDGAPAWLWGTREPLILSPAKRKTDRFTSGEFCFARPSNFSLAEAGPPSSEQPAPGSNARKHYN
jgi:hypothetical protein